jgi:hypothetical protein
LTHPVRVPKPLKKKLARKDATSQGAILGCFRQLREDWRHPGLRAKKLSGRISATGQPVFEARATGGDRVTFYWDGSMIVIENHCKHDILKPR